MPLLRRHLTIAIRRKVIHETVRGGIIGLSHIPHRSSDGRKQHEEIQFHFSGRLIEVVRPRDFWSQDLIEFSAGLFQDEVIRNGSSTVKDAIELSVFFLNGRYKLLYLIGIA